MAADWAGVTSTAGGGWGLLGLALLASLPLAAAHSDLVAGEPADGARLDAAPAWVALHFSGPIDPAASSAAVRDALGARVDRDDLRTEGTASDPVLNLTLQAGLGDGAYAVRWSILSDDGHPNSGTLRFTVGNATASADETASPPAARTASVAGRVLAYAGLALALGAAAWLWVVRAGLDGMQRPATSALALGALLHAAGTLLLFLDTLRATGLPADVLASSATGRLLTLRALLAAWAFALALVALLRPGRVRLPLPLAAALMLVAAVATAAVGHAAGQGLPGLASDAMHLIAAATWAGGLALLLVALRLATRRALPAADVRRIGLRFGTLALGCVLLLVLTGTTTALIILGRSAVTDPLHLTGSLYGRLLLAKVGLTAIMVGLAAVNRALFLAEPVGAGLGARLASLGPDGTAVGLRRTVALEAILALAVLVVAGFLTAVSPTDHAEGDGAEHLHGALPDAAPLLPRGIETSPSSAAGVAATRLGLATPDR